MQNIYQSIVLYLEVSEKNENNIDEVNKDIQTIDEF